MYKTCTQEEEFNGISFMRYDILHELPGRMRVHLRNVRLSPDNRLELNRWVAEQPELISATFSVRTGNLLVAYAPGAERVSILSLIERLHLFTDANVGDATERDPVATGTTVVAAIAKEALRALISPFIPKPAHMVKSGWRLKRGMAAIAAMPPDEQLSAYAYFVGKFILLGFCLSSLALRLACVAAAALLEEVFPTLRPRPQAREKRFAAPVAYAVSQAAG